MIKQIVFVRHQILLETTREVIGETSNYFLYEYSYSKKNMVICDLVFTIPNANVFPYSELR